MYLEIDADDYEKIRKITFTDYDVIYVDKNVLLKENNYKSMTENLIVAYERLNEEFEDYKRNVAENYRQIPIAEQIGIGDEDFIWWKKF